MDQAKIPPIGVGATLYCVAPRSRGTPWELEDRQITALTPTHVTLTHPFTLSDAGELSRRCIGRTVFRTEQGAIGSFMRAQHKQLTAAQKALRWAAGTERILKAAAHMVRR